MLKKVLLGMLIILFTSSSLGSAEVAGISGLEKVSPTSFEITKTDWLGQKAFFFESKMHQTVSYLFLSKHPTQAIMGVEQLNLGKSLINKAYTIEGLYQLKTPTATTYYWHLVEESGPATVWVKDTPYRPLAEQPFALEAEISLEKQLLAQTSALLGLPVWANLNLVTVGELSNIDHLAPLTITAFQSDGPFSNQYVLFLKRDDGVIIPWKSGIHSSTPVYSHKHFFASFQKRFYQADPFASHPAWNDATWSAIKNRKVLIGFNKEMVLLSWGEAKKITKQKDGELWEYSEKKYLLFTDSLLTKIKVVDLKAAKEAKTTKDRDNLLEVPEAFIK